MSETKRTNPFLLVGLPVLAVLVAGLALYIALIRVPTQQSLTAQQEALVKLLGVTQHVSNKLAPEYTDTDGDLVADAPTDVAKQVDPAVLRISFIATDDPETYKTAFAEFSDGLAKATGKKVEYGLYNYVRDEIRALKDGELHVCALNTGNVPRAVNLAGFVPVAAMATSDGDPYIRAVFITPAASAIKSLSDIKGGLLVVTDLGSNSGYRVPVGMLKAQGLLPERDYQLRYSGSHENSIQKVAGGTTDLAGVASDILGRELTAKNLTPAQYRKVAESEKFPSGTIGYAYNLKPELATKIRDYIVGFDWKGTGLEKTFGGGGSAKFAPIKYKDDFALVRRIDDDTGNVHSLDY